jgi:hypothetical protein
MIESATRRTPLWDHLTTDDEADLNAAKVDLARFRACLFRTQQLLELSRASIQESRQLIAVMDRHLAAICTEPNTPTTAHESGSPATQHRAEARYD